MTSPYVSMVLNNLHSTQRMNKRWGRLSYYDVSRGVFHANDYYVNTDQIKKLCSASRMRDLIFPEIIE